MTDNHHPITPPLELLKYWEEQHFDEGENYDVMLIQAYQAGADLELEACCEWVSENVYRNHPFSSHELRTTRRPKPLSLRTRVKEIIDCLVEGDCLDDDDAITLRLALEQLND